MPTTYTIRKLETTFSVIDGETIFNTTMHLRSNEDGSTRIEHVEHMYGEDLIQTLYQGPTVGELEIDGVPPA